MLILLLLVVLMLLAVLFLLLSERGLGWLFSLRRRGDTPATAGITHQR